jgi:hypothetical protein
MNWNDKLAGEDDPVIAPALKNFKASVDAWSKSAESAEAAGSRPRATLKVVRHRWRLAAAWALGCVLAASSLAGALYERQHRHELARTAAAQAAAQRAAQQQRAAEQQTASAGDQDLLANVDNDISRAVPAAMEPLAQMMDSKSADKNGTK